MKRIAITLAVSLSTVALLAGDTTIGTFDRGTKYAAPDDHAPAAVSRMMVRTLTADEARAGVDLPATGQGGMIIWTIPLNSSSRVGADTTAPKARPALIAPSGQRFNGTEDKTADRAIERFRFDSADLALGLPGGTHDVIHVAQTEAAPYHLELGRGSDVAGVTLVAAEPDSRLTLSSWAAPLSRMPGQPVTLHAELREGDEALVGARVTARLAAPGHAAGEPVALFDDGAHGDGLADDGVYGAIVPDLADATAGMWSVRYEADGVNSRGVRFARTGSGAFMNERGAARLRDVHGAVAGDVLHITASADVAIAGSYRFDVIVAGAANAAGERESLAWGEATANLGAGARELSLDIPRSALGANGNLLLDVRLLGLDPIGVAGRTTVEVNE